MKQLIGPTTSKGANGRKRNLRFGEGRQMKTTRLIAGFKRQWARCKTCRRIVYYDYQPHSLSNPVMVLPCGHGLSVRFMDSIEHITVKQARYWLRGKGRNSKASNMKGRRRRK